MLRGIWEVMPLASAAIVGGVLTLMTAWPGRVQAWEAARPRSMRILGLAMASFVVLGAISGYQQQTNAATKDDMTMLEVRMRSYFEGEDPNPCVFADAIVHDDRAQFDAYTGKISTGTWVEFGIHMRGKNTITIQNHEMGLSSERPIGIPPREMNGGSTEWLTRRVMPAAKKAVEFKYSSAMRGGKNYSQKVWIERKGGVLEVSIPEPCGGRPKRYELKG